MVVNTFVEWNCRIIIIFHTEAWQGLGWLAAYNATPANGFHTEEGRAQFAVYLFAVLHAMFAC